MEESTRQNLVMAFNNVLRTSSLVGLVDFQRAALTFGALLEHSDGAALQLQPLHDFLIEQGAPAASVVEVIVFLKSRESRFGLQMELPPALESLSTQERDALVANFTSRGATSGTRSGARTGQTGTHSRSQSGPLVVPATTAMPSPSTGKVPTVEHPAKFSTGPSRKAVANIAAIVIVLFGVGNAIYLFATRAPPPTPLAFTDPAGLPCVAALGGSGQTVLCPVPNAFLNATTPQALDARGAVSKAFVLTCGYKRILVLSIEENKVRKVF